MAPKNSPKQSIKTFTYIRIPVDESEEIEELEMKYDENDKHQKENCLVDWFPGYYRGITSEEQRQAMEEAEIAKIDTKGIALSTTRKQELANRDEVTVQELLHGVAMIDWHTIVIHYDNKGSEKTWKKNERATDLCLNCLNNTQIYGDAFVERVADDDKEYYERLSMTKDEGKPGAAWVKQCMVQTMWMKENGDKLPDGQVKTMKELKEFSDKLEVWVDGKLKEWDANKEARKKHEKKHANREDFEKSLREKVAEKIAAVKAPVPLKKAGDAKKEGYA